MTIREKAAMMKMDSSKMASTDITVRNAALEKIAESLLQAKSVYLRQMQKIWSALRQIIFHLR